MDHPTIILHSPSPHDMTSLCSQCGSRTRPRTPSPGLFHSHRDEIDFINQEFSRLDSSIRLLLAEKASLSRRLNELESDTRIIPPETLSLIFHHACLFDEPVNAIPEQTQINIAPLFQIGAVCSLWRQTAWSTPALWSTIIADIQVKNAESIASLLEICLHNAGTIPLTLDLRFVLNKLDHATLNAFPISAQVIADLLLNQPLNAEKIRALRLCNPPVAWASHLSEQLRNLEVLCLVGLMGGLGDMRAKITLPYLSSLRCCSLSTRRRIVMPSAETVTKLELSRMHVDAAIGLLRRCANVEECHFHHDSGLLDTNNANRNHVLERNFLTSPITFPCLRALTWPLSTTRSSIAFYQHIRLPVLKTLQLSSSFKGALSGPIVEALRTFLNHAPPSLEAIRLARWSCTHESTQRILPLLPDSIRELALFECTEDFSGHFLGCLIPDSSGDVMYLPSLQQVQLTTIDGHGLKQLMRVVEDRQDRNTSTINIILPGRNLLPKEETEQLEMFTRNRRRLGFRICLYFSRYAYQG
ncbi:hypothetical protein NP233_g3837 [Leucocoprinus birnbaumii]|uniref:F-box domain-containing protein n=1 Tax=Leucocoprinus birnbaumii TaxID=56174 RepID=A0AAD5VX83_9AGAR|nr:hypothetical protein NP233_g3837 [Leucocoprinus birnbaumii]